MQRNLWQQACHALGCKLYSYFQIIVFDWVRIQTALIYYECLAYKKAPLCIREWVGFVHCIVTFRSHLCDNRVLWLCWDKISEVNFCHKMSMTQLKSIISIRSLFVFSLPYLLTQKCDANTPLFWIGFALINVKFPKQLFVVKGQFFLSLSFCLLLIVILYQNCWSRLFCPAVIGGWLFFPLLWCWSWLFCQESSFRIL